MPTDQLVAMLHNMIFSLVASGFVLYAAGAVVVVILVKRMLRF